MDAAYAATNLRSMRSFQRHTHAPSKLIPPQIAIGRLTTRQGAGGFTPLAEEKRFKCGRGDCEIA